jgi:hypothetical protein
MDCPYFISDVVVIHAILKLMGQTDHIPAQRQMHEELNLVYNVYLGVF